MVRNKLVVHVREFMRRTIRLLDYESNRGREYNFARRNVVGGVGSVLDVGGCESLLPIYFAKKGFKVTVVDYRDYPERHPNLVSIKGDFLDNNLPDNAFDYVVMISTIEHIGFGGYGDPIYEDGDFQAMKEAKRVLKPEGRIIITFPFTKEEKIISGFQRIYDIERVRRLFKGAYVLAEEYYIPNTRFFGRWVNFAPASLREIQQIEEKIDRNGCACYVVSLSPRTHFRTEE